MKFLQVLFGAAILLTACSSPKYVYHFDHYDYQSGQKAEKNVAHSTEVSPLELSQETLVARADNNGVVVMDEKKNASSSRAVEVAEKYKAMSMSERRAFRKELKKEIKTFVKKERSTNDVASVKATKEFDTTVSLAMLFGIAGVVLIILAGVSNVFWVLGAISLVIGAVFFIQWVANGNG